MKDNPRFKSGLSLGLMLLVAGCIPVTPRVWKTAEENLAEKAAGVESLVVETHNGHIKLSGAQGADKVSVHVIKKAGGLTEEEATACMQAIELESKVEGGTMQLGWKWAKPREKTWQASVSFEIELPNTIRARATTHNGAVELAGMVATASLETHNGAITVNNVKGSLKVNTHNGRIDVADHSGDLDARTSNGGVNVQKPAGDVIIETHNGRIDVKAVTSRIEANTHNGAVRIDLAGSAAVNGRITTNNGAVAVRFGDEASARLVCETDNGRIQVENDMKTTVRKKEHLEGTVGDGEGAIEIRTSNGSITLE